MITPKRTIMIIINIFTHDNTKTYYNDHHKHIHIMITPKRTIMITKTYINIFTHDNTKTYYNDHHKHIHT